MSNQGDIAQRSPSVATVDTPDIVKLMSFWADAEPGQEALEKYQAVIAHIDAHVAAQVAAERLRADNADGMAECMRMFRDDMISAGIIGSDVPPMFMSEAILRVVAAKDAEIARLAAKVAEMDTWLGQRPCLRDRCAEYAALSAQAAAPVADSGNDVPVRNVLNSKRQAWECKIGVVAGVEIPRGGDAPMRRAVEKAFFELTGQEPDANFSGWGATFNSAELAVINHQSGGGKQ